MLRTLIELFRSPLQALAAKLLPPAWPDENTLLATADVGQLAMTWTQSVSHLGAWRSIVGIHSEAVEGSILEIVSNHAAGHCAFLASHETEQSSSRGFED